MEILKKLSIASNITTQYFEIREDRIVCTHNFPDLNNIHPMDEQSLKELFDSAPDPSVPFIYDQAEAALFGGFLDAGKGYCLIGPESYRKSHTYSLAYEKLSAVLSLSYFLLTGKSVSDAQIIGNSFSYAFISRQLLTEYNMLNTERHEKRFSYADEVSYMNDIRFGRVENVKRRLNNHDPRALSKVGLFSINSRKQAEYLACSTFTKSSIAAIQGGLPAETAYNLSDLAKQKLELCRTQTDVLYLMARTMIEFAALVAEFQSEKLELHFIEKCKVYICNHLSEDFCLDDIAADVGFSKSYLSRQFSAKCGISLTKYTLNERLNAASNMLKYSDVTIQEISNYLRFPSQSYFGRVFKEKYGITPKKYRDQEKIVDV